MTAALWIGGSLALLALALAPLLTARRRAGEAARVGEDRALALISRLDHALERTDLSPVRRAEAERCRLLAGSALAGPVTPAAAARARRWAVAGLKAVGEPPSP
ncbi:GlyGly-CTERM sorting domain-containing protein [Actinophytocola xanthii]|uniref:Uncharacterized protein n=1 Tax=Actinophytocola xanthii TaxID=1912961 RepID=A0A1Q8CWM2_9PSEU|nr:GlyGly-CTERM sorting domain-containing protein [Actinophytocola xanthii]OLF18736.1 hypothetical protein BU204_04295 [Actinophytocola xanthii]